MQLLEEQNYNKNLANSLESNYKTVCARGGNASLKLVAHQVKKALHKGPPEETCI